MNVYSDEHTSEVLLKQEREKLEQERVKAEQERVKAEQERVRAEKAEKEKEKAEKATQEMAFIMARNLLKLGMGIDQVVQVSGLSEEEIRENSR
jgi:hypothetical protein